MEAMAIILGVQVIPNEAMACAAPGKFGQKVKPVDKDFHARIAVPPAPTFKAQP
jgi:hypothetical protein